MSSSALGEQVIEPRSHSSFAIRLAAVLGLGYLDGVKKGLHCDSDGQKEVASDNVRARERVDRSRGTEHERAGDDMGADQEVDGEEDVARPSVASLQRSN